MSDLQSSRTLPGSLFGILRSTSVGPSYGRALADNDPLVPLTSPFRSPTPMGAGSAGHGSGAPIPLDVGQPNPRENSPRRSGAGIRESERSPAASRRRSASPYGTRANAAQQTAGTSGGTAITAAGLATLPATPIAGASENAGMGTRMLATENRLRIIER